ncbi:hypothetical protein CIRG_02103 [Coccidioides immitis RMSCC 2394]|uniref:Uncharacterized protein n=1 Tax=Coccidioides immitis RMSCC 2394 TaxID=404692 RepID=A0A0J6Y4K6_COCIT|nr:hypothetical protein CIRG_02103 [Coccidioides immitis RMSCC 2394]
MAVPTDISLNRSARIPGRSCWEQVQFLKFDTVLGDWLTGYLLSLGPWLTPFENCGGGANSESELNFEAPRSPYNVGCNDTHATHDHEKHRNVCTRESAQAALWTSPSSGPGSGVRDGHTLKSMDFPPEG